MEVHKDRERPSGIKGGGKLYLQEKKKKGPKRNSKQTDNLFRVMKGYGVSRERQIIQKGSSTGSH